MSLIKCDLFMFELFKIGIGCLDFFIFFRIVDLVLFLYILDLLVWSSVFFKIIGLWIVIRMWLGNFFVLLWIYLEICFFVG